MSTTQTSCTPSPSLEGAGQIGVPLVAERVCAVERFVAVVGPPAVGKSTVSRALAAGSLGAQVFRLREFAHECRSHGTADERLFDTRDSLGWFPEETAFLLLQAAFIQGQFPARGLVVLENFPGSLTQLLLLKAIADQLRAPLMLIELTADNIVVAARARTRRVCPACEPDLRGDPHRPAHPATHDLNRCDSCGGELLKMPFDQIIRTLTTWQQMGGSKLTILGGEPSTNDSNAWHPLTTPGCGTSRPTLAASASPGTPLTATEAASAGPSTGSRSSPTAEPTSARSYSTPTCTSPT